MRPLALRAFASVSVVSAIACARASADVPARPSGGAAKTAVLVELFTSEGCSSCPPADAELTRLARAQPVASAEIVPLAFHVDYWNDLGWPDPFSQAAFTARQSAYSRAMGRSGVYTPQAVVDGVDEMNGADDRALVHAVAAAAARPHASVTLTPGAGTPSSLAVRVAPGAAGEVFVAVTEDDVVVDVPRGENAGRRLPHSAVARSLVRLGSIDAAHGGSFDTALPREHTRVVAFVQDARTKHVLGAAAWPATQASLAAGRAP